MKVLEDMSKCCGCRACEESCPFHCIQMKKQENGFYYPVWDKDRCTDCGACDRVCPAQKQELSDSLQHYIAYASDCAARNKGSSGGMFGLLAEWTVKKKGIVFGAGFTENLRLVSMSAENLEELTPLYRSKYLQADMQGSYPQVKKALEQGRWVLFCSSPCNVQALKSYLNKEYERLFLVDFVCHGVASQECFDKSVSWYEKKKGKELLSFDFRSKEHRINCSRVFCAESSAGKKVNGSWLDFPHYFFYMNQLSLRPSCYTCEYAGERRCSDITIGDFHMPEKYFPKGDRLLGFSSVLCNTEKGVRIMQQLPAVKIAVAKEKLVKYNAALQAPTRSKGRVKFLEDYSVCTFEELLRKHGYFSLKTRLKRMYYKLPRWIQSVLRRFLISQEG